MPRPLGVPRSFPAVLLAVLCLMLASLWLVPPASADEDVATQTAQPAPTTDDAAVTEEPADAPVEEPVAEPTAAPAPEDFEVEFYGPECWDSSLNVTVYADVDTAGLRVEMQEEIGGVWETVQLQRFHGGEAFVYTDHLDEGVTGTFRVVVYHRSTPADVAVLHGPVPVTGVSTEDCEEPEFPFPTLPEEQWTVAEADCGSVTFTSRADVEVVVVWMAEDDMDYEENYFFLAPGESATVETTYDLVYWISATGIGEDLEPIGSEDDIYYAGDGEVVVEQDCGPDEPGAPQQPGGGDHQVPGRVQTDGGADAITVALGLLLMGLAGAGLLRRAA